MPTTHDILVNVHKMFGGKSRLIRQVALKDIMDAKISEGTLIKDHMIRMIGLLNDMEILTKEIIDR